MIRTEVKVYTEIEERETLKKLKETGYMCVSERNCMMAKIYIKGNNEIVLTREY